MTLEDGEILLRPFTEDDVPALTAACHDPEIPRWTRVPSPYTEEDALAFVSRAAEGSFAIVEARTGELLGRSEFGRSATGSDRSATGSRARRVAGASRRGR